MEQQSNTPEPLTPANCDLRDFDFMPVQVRRLLGSDTWMSGSCCARGASMSLWLESWHQVPAGSLPSSDKALAHLSQAGAEWAEVREDVLKGWVLCSDGRLYHRVVCEKALESWLEKLAFKLRGNEMNKRRWGADADLELTKQQMVEASRLLAAINPDSKTLGRRRTALIKVESSKQSNNESSFDSSGDSHLESSVDSSLESSLCPNREGEGEGEGERYKRSKEEGGVAALGEDEEFPDFKLANPPSPTDAKAPRVARQSSPETTLSQWLSALELTGETAIPHNDTIWPWATRIGLPAEFLNLAWEEFERRMVSSGNKQRDWRATFRDHVRRNFLKLWYAEGNGWKLTTAGVMLKRSIEAAR